MRWGGGGFRRVEKTIRRVHFSQPVRHIKWLLPNLASQLQQTLSMVTYFALYITIFWLPIMCTLMPSCANLAPTSLLHSTKHIIATTIGGGALGQLC